MTSLRKVAVIVALTTVILAALIVSTKPVVQPQERPSAQDVRAARELWTRFKMAQNSAEPTRIQVNGTTIKSLATLFSDLSGVTRVEAILSEGTLVGRASIPLSLGLWLNVTAELSGSHSGFPPVHTKVGRIELPTAAAHWLAGLGRFLLRLRGAEVPPLAEVIKQVSVSDKVVLADVALPESTGFLDEVMNVRIASIDPHLVGAIYCRLSEQERNAPSGDLSTLLRRAFGYPYTGDPVARNRATLIAVSFVVVGNQAHRFAPQAAEVAKTCARPDSLIRLRGRDDLAKHWAFSAALTSLLGRGSAIDLGEWKELEDSLAGGSGFSFVDLAANRSGVRIAIGAVEKQSAGEIASSLSFISEQQLLPDTLMSAPEGLEELTFVSRYGGLTDSEYREALRHIDDVLTRQQLLLP